MDAIVAEASVRLKHVGEVAYSIKKAAGPSFKQESIDFVKKHGPPKLGTAVSTSAGKLNAKFVIHAVAPRWKEYKSQMHNLKLHYQTVCSVLIKA